MTNGYKRKNAPKHKKKEVDPATPVILDLDWSFNKDIRNITKTIPISEFCEIQHLKYIAHVIRLPNFAIQKQLLFTTERKRSMAESRNNTRFINNADTNNNEEQKVSSCL